MNETVREVRMVMAPVGVRCRLCRLGAEDDGGGALDLTVKYGGERRGDEGNELVALWRRSYICQACRVAIALPVQLTQEERVSLKYIAVMVGNNPVAGCGDSMSRNHTAHVNRARAAIARIIAAAGEAP